MNSTIKYFRQGLAILFVFSLFNDTFTVELLGAASLKIIAGLFFLTNAPKLLRTDLRPCRYAYLFFAMILFSTLVNITGYEDVTKNR